MTRAAGTDKTTAVYEGNLELVDAEMVAGWAWDASHPELRVKVEVYDGDRLLGTATADLPRQDLVNARKGDGKYGFKLPTPASIKDGKPHRIRTIISGSKVELSSSPKVFEGAREQRVAPARSGAAGGAAGN